MSETQQPTMPPVPDGTYVVTDDKGRQLHVRSLTLLEEMDLIEAAGTPAPPDRWMNIAIFAACIRNIDGLPLLVPTKRNQIRAQVQRVGAEGIRAVAKALAPELPDGVGGEVGEVDPVAAAKN